LSSAAAIPVIGKTDIFLERSKTEFLVCFLTRNQTKFGSALKSAPFPMRLGDAKYKDFTDSAFSRYRAVMGPN
jgi:hypothetical protein